MSLGVVAVLVFALASALFVGSGKQKSRTLKAARLAARSRGRVRGHMANNASHDGAHDDQRGSGKNRRSNPRKQQAFTFAACGVAGLSAMLFIGGIFGFGLAAGVVIFGPRVLGSLETKSARERREMILSDAPLVAELLAACLQAGVSDQRALRSVSSALDGPIVEELGVVLHALSLGTDPSDAWEMLDAHSPLGPIARSFTRSARSGAPLSQLLARVARELRTKHCSDIEAAARSVAVRSVGPLGLCFLPAFILLGVVPLVASLFGQVAPF